MVQNIISFEVFHFSQTILHHTELYLFVEANNDSFECAFVAILKFEMTELIGDSFNVSMP